MNYKDFNEEEAAKLLPKCGFKRLAKHASVWQHETGIEVVVCGDLIAIHIDESDSMLQPYTMHAIVKTLDMLGVDVPNVPHESSEPLHELHGVEALRQAAVAANKKKKKKHK